MGGGGWGVSGVCKGQNNNRFKVTLDGDDPTIVVSIQISFILKSNEIRGIVSRLLVLFPLSHFSF